jgi:hypothetical protein
MSLFPRQSYLENQVAMGLATPEEKAELKSLPLILGVPDENGNYGDSLMIIPRMCESVDEFKALAAKVAREQLTKRNGAFDMDNEKVFATEQPAPVVDETIAYPHIDDNGRGIREPQSAPVTPIAEQKPAAQQVANDDAPDVPSGYRRASAMEARLYCNPGFPFLPKNRPIQK